MTQVIQLDPRNPDANLTEQAAAIIRSGGLVAFPTETVYGLGADAMNDAAVARVFQAKGRPPDNPLIVHVCDRAMVDIVATHVSPKAEALIAAFWPGPLTLVLKRNSRVAESVSAGLETVAVRMPNSKIALALIHLAGTPIAAPSANISTRPSPTSAAHVERDLAGRIDMIIDGGPTKIGIESTVLDLSADPPVILRPGWITRESLEQIVGSVEVTATNKELQHSPGTRHRHYSPRARLVLIGQGSSELIESVCQNLLKDGEVGLISHTPIAIEDPRFTAVFLTGTAEAYARSIYSAVRELDERGADAIVVEGISEEGEGSAVMDRLRRAASQMIES